jgi:ABC-type sugar transport system substrate-binding protein
LDVRIGVTQSPKELEVLLAEDTDPDAVRAHVEKAVSNGGTLWLTDRRGRQVGVPVDKVAYVEIGSPEGGRRIGFGG